MLAFTIALAECEAPFPYRPGYELGDWLPPSLFAELQQQASAGANRQTAAIVRSQAMSLIAELRVADGENGEGNTKKSDDVSALLKRASGMIAAVTRGELAAYRTALDGLERLLAMDEASAPPRRQPSPVVWSASGITYADKSSGGSVLSTSRVQWTGSSPADGVSQSAAVLKAAQAGHGLDTTTLGAVKTKLDEVERRLEVHTTVLIVAKSGQRRVKLFDALVLDGDSAEAAWNAFFPSDLIRDGRTDNTTGTADSEVADGHNGNTLALVHEVETSAVLIGMLHIGEAIGAAPRPLPSRARDYIDLAGYVDRLVGSTENSREAAQRLARALDAQHLTTVVQFVGLGYTPRLSSNLAETALHHVATMDPNNVKPKGAAAGTVKGHIQQQDDTAAVAASILQHARHHDASGAEDRFGGNTFGIAAMMDAFSRFSTDMNSGAPVGQPVAFDVKRFTKGDIVALSTRLRHAQQPKKAARER